MSTKGIFCRGRRAVALAGVGVMLAQLAAAGQPARVHFGYDQNDKSDLCLTWDSVPAAPGIADNKLHLVGHLYHRMHGACGFTPVQGNSHGPAAPYAPVKPGGGNSHGPMTSAAPVKPEGLANQQIRIQYKEQGGASAALPGHVTTDDKGTFKVAFPMPSSLTGGLSVTAAYYGQANESGQPLVQAKKELLTHLKLSVLNEDGSEADREGHPAGPDGTYKIRASLISWNSKKLSSFIPPALEVVKSIPRTDAVAQLAQKQVDIKGFSVKGKGLNPGVVAVKAVIADRAIESEPVLLPFGAHAELKRVGDHKGEEIILQRIDGYNSDEGQDGQFFMDEHAQLELKLTSLLSGDPLKDMPVSWRVGSKDNAPGSDPMEVFFSKRVDDDPRPVITATGADGVFAMPVSARHLWKDRGSRSKPPVERAAVPGAGKVHIEAVFNDQVAQVTVPFIDSLWLKAHVAEGEYGVPKWWPLDVTKKVHMIVDGYVGTDGKSQAQRQWAAPDSRDHAIADNESGLKGETGPIYFADKNGVVQPSNEEGISGKEVRPGLAYRYSEDGVPPVLLTGYFTAHQTGNFCLEQDWVSAGKFDTQWWAQAGVKLDITGDLCGEVVQTGRRSAAQ